jgi:hypothetical protein
MGNPWNSEWGCLDGEHKGWLIIVRNSKEEARGILPSVYRSRARIMKLNMSFMEETGEILRHPTG